MRILLVLALLLASSPASAAKKVIAVRDLKHGEGVTDTVTATLTEAVATELRRLPNLRVNTQQEIIAALSLDQQKQILACSDAECMSDFGGALGVSALVTGNLGRLGESWLINLKLIDVVEVAVVSQSDRRIRGGTLDDVLDVLPAMTAELMGAPQSSAAPAPSKGPAYPGETVTPLYVPQPIGAPQPAPAVGPVAAKSLQERFPGVGRFVNGKQKFCLDPKGFTGDRGTNVMLFACDGGKDQLWRAQGDVLHNALGKAVLDVAGTRTKAGSNVELGKLDARQDQAWRVVELGNDWVELRDATSGLCLDVKGEDGKSRDNVMVWTCNQQPDQMWFWERLE